MRIIVGGVPIDVTGQQGAMGPQGPDGNPLGTVISFLGKAAPDGYLACDGSEYNISDYPDLAHFFREQFGTENNFGGDGSITFAVPDLHEINSVALSCIKAVKEPSGDVYSLQERVVGYWIDGRPVYRKTVDYLSTLINTLNDTLIADNVDTLINQYGIIPSTLREVPCKWFPYVDTEIWATSMLHRDGSLHLEFSGDWGDHSLLATFQYTKTTDSPMEVT